MKNYLKFWGTRGSCAVSGAEYLHFGGNTCCLELRYDDTVVIFDAGSGIRPLGHTLAHEKKIDLFLSHLHWDHIVGFPFFEPLYRKGVHITIWTPQGHGRSPSELFDQLLAPEFFPIHLDQMKAHLEFKTIQEKTPVRLGPLTIDFHKTIHPGVTYCFKIKTPHQTIGYVTDNEIDLEKQQSFIAFHKNCDYFIHEAQYSVDEYPEKAGWGHSSITNALELVRQVHPSRWLVTHHDPAHTDENLRALAKLARTSDLPCPVEWIPDHHMVALK
jgi:phosphoribosyl 1,2-cyclic phosphodiesterase